MSKNQKVLSKCMIVLGSQVGCGLDTPGSINSIQRMKFSFKIPYSPKSWICILLLYPTSLLKMFFFPPTFWYMKHSYNTGVIPLPAGSVICVSIIS